MEQRCRACGSPTRRLEVAGRGGGPILFPFPPEVESALGDDFDWDADPRWLCRFIDALACTACGACDLAVADPATYLECDGPYLPTSPVGCPECGPSCRGPLEFECFGAPGEPSAYLAPNYGAPLVGRLCMACGQVLLSLYAEDARGRRELTRRFPDIGPCRWCARGRLHVTRVDVPHAGFGGLYDPALPPGRDGGSACVANLTVAVCDSCGEASARADWLERKPAEPDAASDRGGR